MAARRGRQSDRVRALRSANEIDNFADNFYAARGTLKS